MSVDQDHAGTVAPNGVAPKADDTRPRRVHIATTTGGTISTGRAEWMLTHLYLTNRALWAALVGASGVAELDGTPPGTWPEGTGAPDSGGRRRRASGSAGGES